MRARMLCISGWVGERVSGVYVLCAAFPGIVHRVISARKAVGYAESR